MRSIKWLVLNEGLSRFFPAIVFLVLARLLSPTDFGLVASAQVIISFCQILADGGLGMAIIQTSSNKENSANAAFWFNLTFGVMLYVFIYLAAPWLQIKFGHPNSCLVFRVLGLQVIIGALNSVFQTLLIREFKFQTLFWVKFVVSVVPGFISISLALLGFGVWALVFSSLGSSLLTISLLWINTSWRPSFDFEISSALALLTFGKWIVMDSLIGWFITWGDSMVVGLYFGAEELGIYRVSQNIVSILFGMAIGSVMPVVYPSFSRLQHDLSALKIVVLQANRLIVTVALPLGVGMYLLAPYAIPILLGDKWINAHTIVGILALQSSVGWLVACNPDLYRAIGRPDIQTKIGMASLFFYVPVYLVSVKFGLIIFASARLLLSLAILPVHILAIVRTLNLSPFYMFDLYKSQFCAVIIMTLLVIAATRFFGLFASGTSVVFVCLVLILVGLVSYFGSLILFDRQLVESTIRLMKRAVFS